jgi:hypothetical protein
MEAAEVRNTQNEAALLDIETFLTDRDVAHSRKGDAIRAELRVGTTVYAIAYFVSAPFLFTVDEAPDERYDEDEEEVYLPKPAHSRTPEQAWRRFQSMFMMFQSKLMDEDYRARPRKDLTLIAVGSEHYLFDELDLRRRSHVQLDQSLARKRLVTFAQMEKLLTCPFPQVAQDANALPRVDVCPEVNDLPDNSPKPTDVFDWRVVEALLTDTDVLLPESAGLRSRTEAILLRVMEGEYRLFWQEDHVAIGRYGDKRGSPLPFASAGEQKAYALAYFLAKLSFSMTPATRIALHGALNGLSLLWLFGALDVLREMVIASGASLQLQMPQSERRELAKMKLEAVANVVMHTHRFR